MPFTSNKALFTDKDPNGPEVGAVLESGGSFRLCAAGGAISDELARKFGLDKQEGVEPLDTAKANAEREERNRATYAQNAASIGGAQHQGYPTQVNAAPVTEAPPVELAPESKTTTTPKK